MEAASLPSDAAAAAQSGATEPASNHLGIVAESSAGLLKQRDRLRRAASSILYQSGLEAAAQHRTVWCGRTLLGAQAGVYRARDGTRARVSGVATCTCIWTCALCALHLAEERRAELSFGMAQWSKAGGHVYLMTQTFRHSRDDCLPELLAKFRAAQKRFKQSTAYKRVADLVGRRGGVRSIETTWGAENGWHPHSHELLFYTADLARMPRVRLVVDSERGPRFVGGVVSELRGAWVAALAAEGLDGTEDRAFDIRPGDYAAEYVAKFGRDVDGWDVQDELTSRHAKVGKTAAGRAHYSPFQMLALWAAGDRSSPWGELFRAYAAAFAQQRMLYWSPKLKGLLGLRDKTDEEIAAELGRDRARPEEDRIGELTVRQYAIVYSRGAVGGLLDLARILDDAGNAQAAIDDYVEWLKGLPRICQERMRYRRHGDRGQVEYNAREWAL
jgi:hypothetical protein